LRAGTLTEPQAINPEETVAVAVCQPVNTEVSVEDVKMMVGEHFGNRQCNNRKRIAGLTRQIMTRLRQLSTANENLQREIVEPDQPDYSMRAAILQFVAEKDKDGRGIRRLRSTMSSNLTKSISSQRYRELAATIFHVVQSFLVSLRHRVSKVVDTVDTCHVTANVLRQDIEPQIAQVVHNTRALPPSQIRNVWKAFNALTVDLLCDEEVLPNTPEFWLCKDLGNSGLLLCKSDQQSSEKKDKKKQTKRRKTQENV
jgi:hypothetical protein